MFRGRAVTISIVALHLLVGIWVIGVVRPGTFRFRRFGDSTTLMLFFDGGQARLTCWISTDPSDDPSQASNVPYQARIERFGFGMEADFAFTGTNTISRMYRVMLPMWALLGTCLFYPTLAFFRGPFTRMRRRRLNCCVPCGYSLIGNISGVCPECGSNIPRRTNGRSYRRWTYAIEAKLWRFLDRFTVRRVVAGLVVLVLLAIGVEVFRARPWENATSRAYRICDADGLSREQIESHILTFGGRRLSQNPLYSGPPLQGNMTLQQIQALIAQMPAAWVVDPGAWANRSPECQAAIRDAAKASPSSPPTGVFLPPTQSNNPRPSR